MWNICREKSGGHIIQGRYSPGRRMPVFITLTLAVFLLILVLIFYILHQNIINQKEHQKVKADSTIQTTGTPADTSGRFAFRHIRIDFSFCSYSYKFCWFFGCRFPYNGCSWPFPTFLGIMKFLLSATSFCELQPKAKMKNRIDNQPIHCNFPGHHVSSF